MFSDQKSIEPLKKLVLIYNGNQSLSDFDMAFVEVVAISVDIFDKPGDILISATQTWKSLMRTFLWTFKIFIVRVESVWE